MAKKARPVRKKAVRRNPLARVLAGAKFRLRVVPKPGLYKRRPKHRKEGEVEA
jgi:hypothetical protein